MNSETTLIYFIKSKKLNSEDYNNISRYTSSNIFIIRYSKVEKEINEPILLEKFREKNIYLLKRINENSKSIIEYVIDYLLYRNDNLAIDISNASPYHSSKLTSMGIRWGFDVICQFEGEKEFTNEHRNYYDLTSKDERLILDAMNLESQSFIDIGSSEGINGHMCRSNLYKLLNRLEERNLIEKSSVKPPDGYKGKTLHGFKMNSYQYLDYVGFKKEIDEYNIKLSKIKRKKEYEKQIHQSLKRERYG